ncbi:MAG TPA: LysR substrate-binding domain-containing protein [Ramlibacter sp.]|nr:LysR substrate-binding domain-containing protein [Ramlibacter sp.]
MTNTTTTPIPAPRRTRLPPLNAVRAFEAAARHLNLAEAAEELCVTRAAVGQQVRQLEEVLGLQLFNRGPSGLSLTERGRGYYVAVAHAIAILADATDTLSGNDAGQTLRIVAQPNFATKWLVPRLPAWQALHPELALSLSAGSVRFDFGDQEADVAIVYGSEFSNVQSHLLFDTHIVPLCSPQLAARLRSPADLQPLLLLGSRYLPHEWRVWLDLAGLPLVDHRGGPVFDSTLLAVEAARAGLGVALGQLPFVRGELERGELVVPFDTVLRQDMAWHLIYPSAARRVPRIVAFRDWILEEVRRCAMDAAGTPRLAQ